MLNLVRSIQLAGLSGSRVREMLRDEWLVTNGLGGYASGTICGSVTRRYHGLLIAAVPAPFGRVVMLNHLTEYIQLPDERWMQIGGEEPVPMGDMETVHCMTEFRLENQLPVWRFECGGISIEKRLFMVYGQNTTCVSYELKSGPENVSLQLRPSLHFRRHDHAVSEPLQKEFQLSIIGQRYEISSEGWLPRLRLVFPGCECTMTHDCGAFRESFYLRESERGYESVGQLWSPGIFQLELSHRQPGRFLASTESWEKIVALAPDIALGCEQRRRERLISQAVPEARQGVPAELVLAADQFVITPVGRTVDRVRAHAAGDEIRTVIAGYHWFTDWGRDTMISLEGLTLMTGRYQEAGWILRTFAGYIRDGLIPNLFPEEAEGGLYHTADATLWFFHALNRYLEFTKDQLTLKLVLPQLTEIVALHQEGTRFGIQVDPADGLLVQGEEGYQLTWMDAKAGDWVVTPRRGKAVEINALWYNALRLLEKWMTLEHGKEAARPYGDAAARVFESFNRKFWYAEGGYLYDVAEGERGNDHAFRPNQLLAISLEHPVLEPRYWSLVLDKVSERLLTPVGLRSLSQDHPDYKNRYFGDLRSRDAAYHQGTVWAWLIGPYIDALLATHPERKEEALHLLERISDHHNEACLGSVSEIFDAEEPFVPRGCIAQAWSVAELLRCWVKVLK
jgi:predicted glycogen debranching enzyme